MRGFFLTVLLLLDGIWLGANPAGAQQPGPNDPPELRQRFAAAIQRGCSENWAWSESHSTTPEKRAWLQRMSKTRLKRLADDTPATSDWMTLIRNSQAGLSDLACGAAAPDDSSQFILMVRLADGLRQAQRWREAELTARQTVDFARSHLQQDHGAAAEALHILALVVEAEGHFDKAKEARRQEAELREFTQTQGGERTVNAHFLTNGAWLRSRLQSIEMARSWGLPANGEEKIIRDILEEADHRFVSDDITTQKILSRLADVLIRERRFDGAAAVLQRALRIPESAADQPHMQRPRDNRSWLLASDGAFLDSIWQRETALDEVDRRGVAPHLHELTILNLSGQRRFEEALRQAQADLATAERSGSDAALSDAEELLGAILIKAEQYSEAVAHLRHALLLLDRLAQSGIGFSPDLRERQQALLVEALWRAGQLQAAENEVTTLLASNEPRVLRHIQEEKKLLTDGSIKPGGSTRFDVDERLAYARSLMIQGAVLTERGHPDQGRIKLEQALALATQQLTQLIGANRNQPLFAERELQRDITHWMLTALRQEQGSAALQRALALAQMGASSGASDALVRAGARIMAARSGVSQQVAERETLRLTREAAEAEWLAAQSSGGNLDAFDSHARASAAQHVVDERLSDTDKALDSQFPNYWDLVEPMPVQLTELQGTAGLLRDNEVLALVTQSPAGVFVFVISRDAAAWTQAKLDAPQLDVMVARLRCGLDPALCRDGNGGYFDRATAWALYQALFGDPELATVLGRNKRLLFVANGALTALPPAVLVTAPPQGKDDDALDLRETHWLIRDRAVGVLPSLVSLRTLRRQVVGVEAPDPFLGFAPAFDGLDSGGRGVPARGGDFFTDGTTLLDRLRQLPALSGDIEVEAMRGALNAPASAVLRGRHASKPALEELNRSGSLARARVVTFATHGLVSGEFGLGEPALVLAPPANLTADDDGLLRASDAAALRLNADWVVLSACNTGAGATPEAEGLSGLARAFLFAGAHALLVSHWRVRDDAARFLTTRAITNTSGRASDRAEALRAAELALLDDTSLDDSSVPFSSPTAWAPFVLIGD